MEEIYYVLRGSGEMPVDEENGIIGKECINLIENMSSNLVFGLGVRIRSLS